MIVAQHVYITTTCTVIPRAELEEMQQEVAAYARLQHEYLRLAEENRRDKLRITALLSQGELLTKERDRLRADQYAIMHNGNIERDQLRGEVFDLQAELNTVKQLRK